MTDAYTVFPVDPNLRTVPLGVGAIAQFLQMIMTWREGLNRHEVGNLPDVCGSVGDLVVQLVT